MPATIIKNGEIRPLLGQSVTTVVQLDSMPTVCNGSTGPPIGGTFSSAASPDNGTGRMPSQPCPCRNAYEGGVTVSTSIQTYDAGHIPSTAAYISGTIKAKLSVFLNYSTTKISLIERENRLK